MCHTRYIFIYNIWTNENTRDRCDRIYKGDLRDCIKTVTGDYNTRGFCPRYTGKCAGNTNPIEDINCSLGGNNLILKDDAYNIDRSGNSYETCCVERNVEEIIRQGRINSQLIDSGVQSAIQVGQRQYDTDGIFTRLR